MLDTVTTTASPAPASRMAISAAWERYGAWNEALGSVFFTSANDGRPVYLDMDDDVLSGLALEIGVEPTDVAAQLADTVRATLCLESWPESVFEQHLRNLQLWQRVTLSDWGDTHPRVPRDPSGSFALRFAPIRSFGFRMLCRERAVEP